MKQSMNDEKIKRVFEPLREVPQREASAAARGRATFLAQAARLRMDPAGKGGKRFVARPLRLSAWNTGQRRLVRLAVTVSLVVVLLFGGAATTVYAAQDSLPGENLYEVKLWSEDSLLALTSSSEAQLSYILDFSDRRIAELERLVMAGKPIPERVVTRQQEELEQLLLLTARLEGAALTQGLEQISLRAETQLERLASLMTKAPQTDQPALTRMQLRLHEQLELARMGQKDSNAFRTQMQQRHSFGIGSGEGGLDVTTPSVDTPTTDGYGSGTGTGHPTGSPGRYGPGPHAMEGTPSPAEGGSKP